MTLATKPANLALLKKKGVALADAVTTKLPKRTPIIWQCIFN